MTREERNQKLIEAFQRFDVAEVERLLAERRRLNQRLFEDLKQLDYAAFQQVLEEGADFNLNALDAAPKTYILTEHPLGSDVPVPMFQQYVLLRGRNKVRPKIEPFVLAYVEESDAIPRLRVTYAAVPKPKNRSRKQALPEPTIILTVCEAVGAKIEIPSKGIYTSYSTSARYEGRNSAIKFGTHRKRLINRHALDMIPLDSAPMLVVDEILTLTEIVEE